MNDETPNLFETVGDGPLEARIVAWVVGEASSFEVAELERLCAERPELLIFRRRMLALQGLLRQAEAVEPDRSWKLPASKRRMLDEILGEENGRRFDAPQVVPGRHYAGRAWFAIAACLVLTVVVRELMSAKSLVPKVAVSSPVQATGVRVKADEIERLLARNDASSGPLMARSTPTPAAPLRTPGAEGSYRVESKLMGSDRRLGMQQTKEQSQLAKNSAKVSSGAAVSTSLEPVLAFEPTDLSVMNRLPSIMGKGLLATTRLSAEDKQSFNEFIESLGLPVALAAAAEPGRHAPAMWSVLPLNRSDGPQHGKVSQKSSGGQQQFRGPAAGASLGVGGLGSSGERLTTQNPMATLKSAQDADQSLGGESGSLSEVKWADPRKMSDASFQLAQAALAKGTRSDPTRIAIEQFYNAVDYGDPAPTAKEAILATIEQSAHPMIPGRSLVRVGLRNGWLGHDPSQPLRLTLLVDQSGPMAGEDRWVTIEQFLTQLGAVLGKDDLITIVGFSNTSEVLVDGIRGDKAKNLSERVKRGIRAGESNLEQALQFGEQVAKRHGLSGAQNRMVVVTAGGTDLSEGNAASLLERVAGLRQQGLVLDVIGIGGSGHNRQVLSELASRGDGRYEVLDHSTSERIVSQFAGAFRLAAEELKVQVNFNPQRVGKYRLLGFEKDRLKTEISGNEVVERVANQAGVAIYQVEPLAEGRGELGEVRVSFRHGASGERIERVWKIGYEPVATSFEGATASMQLAGLSLLAAEKLKDGPLADLIDFGKLTHPRARVLQFYRSSPRVAEMLRLVDALD